MSYEGLDGLVEEIRLAGNLIAQADAKNARHLGFDRGTNQRTFRKVTRPGMSIGTDDTVKAADG